MKNNKKIAAFTLIELSIVLIVVGILITGILKGAEMYSQSRLVTARNLTVNSHITRLDNLTLWFEPSRIESFDLDDVADDRKIANWYSITPRDNKKIAFSQPDVNKQPKYTDEGINDIPSLYFDGQNDYLFKDNIRFGDILGSNKGTIFVVLQVESAPPAYIFDYRKDGVNIVVTGIYYENSASFTYSDNKAYGLSGTKSAKYYSNKHIVRYVKNGSNMQIVFNGDTTNSISSNSLGQKISENLSANFVIGARYSKDSVYLPGFIGEFIVFSDALEDEQIAVVEDYLSQKWKIDLKN